MPSYMNVRWVTSRDIKVCKVCRNLGEAGLLGQWVLNSQAGVPATLDVKTYGPVWDTIADVSLAHNYLTHSFGDCRCHLEFDEPDCTELQTLIRSLIIIYERGIAQLLFEEALPGVP